MEREFDSEHQMDTADTKTRHASGDRTFLLWASIAVLLVVNLPVVLAYLQPEPPGMRFAGTLDRFPGDLYYHMSFATQTARGNLLFEDKYNGARVQTHAFPNALFLAVGALEWAGLGDEAAYHVMRNAVALLLLFSVQLLCRRVIRTRPWRRAAFLLASLGSGLAWIVYAVALPACSQVPARMWSQCLDTNPWFAWLLDGWLLELSPYWLMETEFVAPAVMALTLIFWALFVDPRTWREPRRLVVLALVPAGIALTHPHDVVNLAAGMAVLLVWGALATERPPWMTLRVLWLGVPALPLYAWMAWLLLSDPVLQDYASLTDSDSPIGLIGGLGLPVLILAWRSRDLLAGSWPVRATVTAAATGVLLFSIPLPITGQYYNIHALSIFVAVAAAAGLERMAALDRARLARGVAVAALLLAPLTNAAHVTVQMLRVHDPRSPFFVSKSLVGLLSWSRSTLPDDAVVLAVPDVARHVPFRTGCRVVLAQSEQTADFDRAMADFEAFLEHFPREPDLGYLRESGATHVIVGPELRARLGSGAVLLEKHPGLIRVRREGPYTLLAYYPTSGASDS